jgi:hypothetical protein
MRRIYGVMVTSRLQTKTAANRHPAVDRAGLQALNVIRWATPVEGDFQHLPLAPAGNLAVQWQSLLVFGFL